MVPPGQPLVSRPMTPHKGAQASASSSWGPCSGQADACAVGTLGLACDPIIALQGGGVQQGCQTQSPLGAEMRLATYLGLAPADIQDTGLRNQGPLMGWEALPTVGEHP